MDTYDIKVGDEVVESINQDGRCHRTMCFIVMDRVFALTKHLKADVDVYIRSTGEPCRYV